MRGDHPALWVHPIDDPVALEAQLVTNLRPPWNLR